MVVLIPSGPTGQAAFGPVGATAPREPATIQLRGDRLAPGAGFWPATRRCPRGNSAAESGAPHFWAATRTATRPCRNIIQSPQFAGRQQRTAPAPLRPELPARRPLHRAIAPLPSATIPSAR